MLQGRRVQGIVLINCQRAGMPETLWCSPTDSFSLFFFFVVFLFFHIALLARQTNVHNFSIVLRPDLLSVLVVLFAMRNSFSIHELGIVTVKMKKVKMWKVKKF